MKGKMKLATARLILRALIAAVAAALILGFVGLYSMVLAIEIAIALGVVYTAVKLLFWRCPHCGRILGSLRLDTAECYYCKEKLEE